VKDYYAILKDYFGYSSFRPKQEEAIRNVLSGKDSLVLLPTGGGKSLCYQIPALAMEGTGLIVSPLISLMQDQVTALQQLGVRAAFLNSTQSPNAQNEVVQALRKGNLQLLYVSPEKAVSPPFLSLLHQAPLCLIAIDEAHCISAWGHDFRPEYTQLSALRQNFSGLPVVALTATADPTTRQDIVRQLELREPGVFISSFNRSNLFLEVRPGQKRLEQILQFVEARPDQPGIVYCLSRKNTEKLAGKLQAKGVQAHSYHAGMPASERQRVQNDFIHDRTQVICATVAFGMGIDKSNVRWIIHYNLPKSIENYYQEIGRSGRDGAPAEALLFYSFADVLQLQEMLSRNASSQEDIQQLKLNQMKAFAESLVCRRRILLNYFGEPFSQNCGHCDVCRKPPERFDGTILAQQALSAVYRLRQEATLTQLIDVLKGSAKPEIRSRGWHRIKTFGVGRKVAYPDWQFYLQQLVQMGYLQVDLGRNRRLKLNLSSKAVLFDKEPVQLVQRTALAEYKQREKERLTRKATQSDALFEKLRQLRKSLAREQGVPPYVIFNDATLRAMVEHKPLSPEELLRIPGLAAAKLKRYGPPFLDAIREYVHEHGNQSRDGSSRRLSVQLYQEGYTLEEIATRRKRNLNTIVQHLAAALEEGESLDVSALVPAELLEKLEKALPYLEKPIRLRALYEYFDEQYDYNSLRLGLSLLKGQGMTG